jgi:hypothetical protein
MGLSQKQLQNVCMRYGGSNQCRYLGEVDYVTCVCLKLTGQKAALDAKVKQTIAQQKVSGQNPRFLGMPIGDGGSCPGYPYLKTVTQGYDVKKP